MAGYSESSLAEFNTKWRDLFNVAKAHSISPAAVQSTYNLDLQRLSNGQEYALSKEEAYSAMQSASQGSPTTAAPAAPFSAGRLPGYLGSDVKNFGVGLLGIVKSALGDVVHPTHIGSQVSSLWRDPMHTLETFVPGAADIETVLKADPSLSGSGGAEQLAEHPFTSLLDVLPELSALGKVGKAASGIGLTDAERSTVEDASRYRPTDVSNEAQSARAKAAEAVPNALRRAALQSGSSGLVSMMHRLVLDTPLYDETMGSRVAHRITASSGGQLGPVAAMVGRMLQSTRREVAGGMKDISDDLDGWYTKHGLASTTERTDFSWLLTHFRDDWRQAYADRFAPGEADKLENALHDYDARLDEQTNKDLAADRLATVTDPRTGVIEIRALEGDDKRVVSAQNVYTKRHQAALDTAHDLATLTGVDVPADAAGAWSAVQGALAKQLLEPALPFIGMELGDPAALRSMFPTAGEATRRVSLGAAKRVARLFGQGGSFARLARALGNGDLPAAQGLVSSILTTLRSSTARRNANLEAMIPAYEQARATIAAARKASVPKALLAHDRARDALQRAIDRHPEARFAPRMAELVQDRLLTRLNGAEVNPEDFAMLFDQISNGLWKGEKFGDLVGAREMGKIRASALSELERERSQGFAPRFVYSTRLGEHEDLARASFSQERIPTTRSARSRTAINPSAVYDPIVGLFRKQADDLTTDAMREFFYGEQGFIPRFGVSYDDAIRQALQLVKETPADSAVTRQHLVDAWVREHYTEIRPTDYFPRRPASPAGIASTVPALVPKDVAQALEANLKATRVPHNVGARAYIGGTRIFRRTLLGYSPRYQAHIWAGGSALLLMRSDPITIMRHLPAAMGMTLTDHGQLLKAAHDDKLMAPLRPVFEWMQRKAARAGEPGGLPVRISHELPESDPQDLLNHFNYAKGRKLATWWKEIQDSKSTAVRAGASLASGQAGMDLASFGANMLRATAYLVGKARAGGDVEAGIRFALKVYADMDSMTPMERTIIRYTMPFYGWTRHVLHYVATLPLDHPYRAAVLSQVVNQEWQDWNSGLPQSMMYLFELGGTAADGTATVLDIRQLDPLRSVTDVFTMAGFLSTLNPAFQNVVLPALGIDPASGGPEQLYPTMTLDQFSGGETPTPASLSSVLEAGVMGYVPEAGVLDHFLGWSSYTRWAKQNDPQAYANQLTSALNFPWVPQKINLTQQIAKTEVDRYNVARDAATAALADPDPNSSTWKNLMAYGYVPYEGWFVQPQELRSWAFDQVAKAGYWNGSVATLPPSSIIVAPYAPNL